MLLLHILISVFEKLLSFAFVSIHNYLFAEVYDFLHERLENVEKFALIGNDLAVKALFELIYAVVRVCFIVVEWYALKIIDIVFALQSPVYHRPLHEIVRVEVSVVVCGSTVNIAGLACILCCYCT